MQDEVKEEEIVDTLNAQEASEIAMGVEDDIFLPAVDKGIAEVCKYIRTTAKAGYTDFRIEANGWKQLPQYVEPRAYMLSLSDPILEAITKELQSMGYKIKKNADEVVISFGHL